MNRALPGAALLSLLAALATSACSDLDVEEIKLRLTVDSPHLCPDEGLRGVFAVHIQMARRTTNQTYLYCVETFGGFGKLADLQSKLGVGEKRLAFDNVQDGLWDFWVLGTDARDCKMQGTQFRLCGTAPIVVPPLSAEVAVPVDCEPALSSDASFEAIKKRITDCRSGMRVP